MLSSRIPTIPRPESSPDTCLALSTDVDNRNNRQDRYQATMNNMGCDEGHGARTRA